MTPFTTVTSRICPIDAADVDTDQILPKQFLKRTERAGFGEFAFFDWRYDADGQPQPGFAMNRPEHQGAAILLAGRNFGCGSSREHAPWALEDAGFAVIIAPSFGDIFRSNCANIGMLAISLDDAVVRALFDRVAADPSFRLTVDLEGCRISGDGFGAGFAIDAHTRRRLLDGADAIALTLRHEAAIDAFETTRPCWRPAIFR